jgi:uncharacterized protein
MNALRFNVAGLLKETAGAVRDYQVDVPPQDLEGLIEDAEPVDQLQGQVRFLRTPRSLYVRGKLHTQLELKCSRCLADVQTPVAFDIDAEYFPEIDISSGQGLPAPDDDLAFTIDANHELDLTEVVRQNLLLALPMHLLCSEACQGLCPQCGADLNNGPCGCQPDEMDDRLSPLRALLGGGQGTTS